MYKCNICSEIKGLNEFYLVNNKPITYCIPCHKAKCKKWRENNKEKDKQRKKNWQKANPEKYKISVKKWYAKNKEKELARGKRNRDANPIKERTRKQKFKKENPEAVAYASAQSRAKRKQATPIWLTKEQKLEIKSFYKKAKETYKLTGMKVEVDHIIPISGKDVCGLHVPWNLQILPLSLNRKKSNKIKEL